MDWEVGSWVSFQMESGETVEGWFYGQLPTGYLVSADPDGRDIRFVEGRYKAASSYPRPGRAKFAPPEDLLPRMEDLNASLKPQMEKALAGLDFGSLQVSALRCQELRRRMLRERFEWLQADSTEREDLARDDEAVAELAMYVAARTDEVLEVQTRVYQALDDAHITDVIAETAEKPRSIHGRHVLPMLDAGSPLSVQDLLASFEQWAERGWSKGRHAGVMNAALDTRNALMFKATSRRRREPQDPKKEPVRGSGLRYLSAGFRILAGAGLAVANCGLGLSAGLGSSLATLGTTTVPIYVGVVASVGTGCAQIADGLEKIGLAQKDSA